jgi:hypothetical protein
MDFLDSARLTLSANGEVRVSIKRAKRKLDRETNGLLDADQIGSDDL